MSRGWNFCVEYLLIFERLILISNLDTFKDVALRIYLVKMLLWDRHPSCRLSNVLDIRVLDIFSIHQPRKLETKRLHHFGRNNNFFFLSHHWIFSIFFKYMIILNHFFWTWTDREVVQLNLHSSTESCYSLTLVPG